MNTHVQSTTVSVTLMALLAAAGCFPSASERQTPAKPANPDSLTTLRPQVHEEPTTAASPQDHCRGWKELLIPLHNPLGDPQPGDWLANHRESGQLFEHYLQKESRPRIDGFARIVIVPIGEATPTQTRIVRRTADYLGANFGIPVEISDTVDADAFPEEARRDEARGYGEQLLTTYILHEILPSRRPKDALAVLAMTTYDLWPGKGWNFVFGQASLANRVGVWSLARYGDPAVDDEAYRLALQRTVKVALHETGHMVGIPHCTAYSCCMNGSNHLGETDRQPLEFCPECQAKVWWTCRYDPVVRLHRLAELARNDGFHQAAGFWEAEAELLRDAVPAN